MSSIDFPPSSNLKAVPANVFVATLEQPSTYRSFLTTCLETLGPFELLIAP